jgi:hypothetical protein
MRRGFGFLWVALTGILLAAVGTIAYQAGWAAGAATQVPAGAAAAAPYYYYGPHFDGFGFFGFFWFLFILFLLFVLFRIAQEALTNIRKHAPEGTRIDVVIEQRDHGYALTVSDDGVGFDRAGTPDSPEGHFGLTSMRERADGAGGWCRIESAEGRGTTVEAWVPEGKGT